jgi:hypothetical protein
MMYILNIEGNGLSTGNRSSRYLRSKSQHPGGAQVAPLVVSGSFDRAAAVPASKTKLYAPRIVDLYLDAICSVMQTGPLHRVAQCT